MQEIACCGAIVNLLVKTVHKERILFFELDVAFVAVRGKLNSAPAVFVAIDQQSDY